jgi:hypothetical protein
MRKVMALDESTGSSNMQDDEPCSYHRLLGVVRSDYERKSVPKHKVVPMAQVSWADARQMADKLKDASDLAFILEANRRGYAIAGKILDGRHYPSGKNIHKSKKRGN